MQIYRLLPYLNNTQGQGCAQDGLVSGQESQEAQRGHIGQCITQEGQGHAQEGCVLRVKHNMRLVKNML